jgi:hypothetical protein
MKQLLFFILVLFSAAKASAQTYTHISTSHHYARSHKKHNKKHNKSAYVHPVIVPAADNRKIYHWTDGQRSTPTGKDAAPTNGGYVSLEKDTTAKAKVKH